MPNIFGKEVSDYAHLVEAREQGHDIEDFDSQRLVTENFKYARATEGGGANLSVNMLTDIDTEIQEYFYQRSNLMDLVPKKSDIARGAEAYGYDIEDGTGLGARVANDASGSDFPSAEVGITRDTEPLFPGGIAARWSYDDIWASDFGGYRFDDRKVERAARGALIHLEKVLQNGNGERASNAAMRGLFNQAVSTTAGDKTAAAFKVGDFHPALTDVLDESDFITTPNADKMVQQINTCISLLMEATGDAFVERTPAPMVMLVPIRYRSALSNTRLGGTSANIAQYLSENNEWSDEANQPLIIRAHPYLKNRGAASKGRFVFFIQHPDVLFNPAPMDPEAQESVRTLNGYEVAIRYRYGEVNILRPAGCLYGDVQA